MAIVTTWESSVALELRVWQSEENYDVWVSYCPALDVYSQGTSEAEARAAIENAVAMYIRQTEKRAQP